MFSPVVAEDLAEQSAIPGLSVSSGESQRPCRGAPRRGPLV